MSVTSAPRLLAIAHGRDCVGDHPCFYCGAPCDGSNATKDHVKPSFTAISTVADPGSPGVCEGCVLAFREAASIAMIDGETRDAATIAMRGYSWVLTKEGAFAASKAHMSDLRRLCVVPPDPPFALVLSDSGQTHQIYRGVVNWSRSHVSITLEGERIDYEPHRLKDMLTLCGKLAACVGKPGLKSATWPASLAARIFARYRDADGLIDEWSRVAGSPLGRLAAWLTPKMEVCLSEYPGDFD